MIVHEITGSEQHDAYQALAAENLDRQYSFLQSITTVSLQLRQPLLSIEVLKALNYHAISCLHTNPGEFRPCPVQVGTDYFPPQHYQLPALMQMFTNQVNRFWETQDAVQLASFVLWRLNAIHPFINGNGRTARAACHYVLCLKAGGWLPGAPILPELIRANREEYVRCLKEVDASVAAGDFKLDAVHGFLSGLIDQQLRSAGPPPATEPTQDSGATSIVHQAPTPADQDAPPSESGPGKE